MDLGLSTSFAKITTITCYASASSYTASMDPVLSAISNTITSQASSSSFVTSVDFSLPSSFTTLGS